MDRFPRRQLTRLNVRPLQDVKRSEGIAISPRTQFRLKLQAVAVHFSSQALILGVGLVGTLIGHAFARTPSPFKLIPFFTLIGSGIRELVNLDWDHLGDLSLFFGMLLIPADLGYALAVWTLPRLNPASEWPLIWWGATAGLVVYLVVTGFAVLIIDAWFSNSFFASASWIGHCLFFAVLMPTFSLAHFLAFRYAIRRGRF